MPDGQKASLPVWFLAAIAIVVLLTVGMVKALLDPSQEVDELDLAVYPPGATVTVVGEANVLFVIGQRTMSPGWLAVGSYPYIATFADGQIVNSLEPVVVVDKHPLTLRCTSVTHSCSME